LVKKYDFGQGRARYELVKKDVHHHHHLICEKCGRVIDYDDFMDEERNLVKKIEEVLSKKHNFKIKTHNLQFYGLCKECQERR
jgi:Fur family ferric uptake transcriptional regulator